MNTHPPDVPLVFNEVTAAGATPFWLELHNYGAALPIRGCIIASELGAQFTIPAQTLASGGFITFDAAQLGFTPVANEKLFLFTPAQVAVLDGAIVKTAHQARRMAAGTGEFLETVNPAEQTSGAVNNVVLSSAIVINEIMYHARPQYRDGATPFAANQEGWVELYNRSAAAVDLSGLKLEDAVSDTIPAGTSLEPGAFLVIANDPVAFNAAHQFTSGATLAAGARMVISEAQFLNATNLSNSGERITLSGPLAAIPAPRRGTSSRKSGPIRSAGTALETWRTVAPAAGTEQQFIRLRVTQRP